MTINASVFLTAEAQFEARRVGSGICLVIRPSGPYNDHLDIHLGHGRMADQAADSRAQLTALLDAIAEAVNLLAPDLAPEPGPDDPTDDPDDEPVIPAQSAAMVALLRGESAAIVCLYCGHANGHPPVQGEGCGACNMTTPLGACHGVGALANAAYRAMAARVAPESPTELAAANGDR